MSSLQKFHRRTLSVGGAYVPPIDDLLVPTGNLGNGSGDNTKGYYLGGFTGGIKLYIAPKSAEALRAWGSSGTIRGTSFFNNGVTNTNTLYAFGSAAHPAAYYCRTLTTGGYNTWYLPAINELTTCWTNHLLTPFATSNAFGGSLYWASTEYSASNCWYVHMGNGNRGNYVKSAGNYPVRAVRRSTI